MYITSIINSVGPLFNIDLAEVRQVVSQKAYKKCWQGYALLFGIY